MGEILDYLKDFSDVFPNVDLGILVDQVSAVRRKNVNPETQIRQFLQAFKNAPTFKKAFDQLDLETQKKVESFRDGASTSDLTQAGGFLLPPSAPAKHHFRLLDAVHSLFAHSHDDKKHSDEHQQKPRLEVHAKPDSIKAPLIYEDTDEKKLMKVRTQPAFLIEDG